MSKNFNTSNESFRKIIGNGITYIVPKFQRDYSWDREHWEDLWQDIIEQLEQKNSEDQSHYMGYLVLQPVNDKEFKIIDGQQRITTLMILILAALENINGLIQKSSNDLDKSNNSMRLEALKSTYIGFTDPVSLITKPKLKLNKNNQSYFRSLCNLGGHIQQTKIKSSERLLLRAKKFFVKKIEGSSFANDGEGIARFIDKMSDILFFTSITVSSDLNAYKVFETLNARGVKLSTPDLIKNHLFSMVDEKGQISDEEIEQLEEKWEAITQNLGKSDFSQFIQVHWNSKNKSTRQNQLFRAIKGSITNKQQLFSYLNELQESSEIFAALDSDKNHEEEFWIGDELKAAKNPLKTLKNFNISQPYSLLIAAYKNFSKEEFCKIFSYIDVVSIRYNVIGQRQANDQERIYNQIALEISSQNIKNLSQIKEKLREIYIDDQDFKSDFMRKEIKTGQSDKKARYLLTRIEKFINSGFSIDESETTLEHILPQKWESYSWWSSHNFEEGDSSSLGNMTLLDKKTNKHASTKSFKEKKELFFENSYKITSQIYEFEEWNHEAILKRQKWLAEQAAKCWKIEF